MSRSDLAAATGGSSKTSDVAFKRGIFLVGGAGAVGALTACAVRDALAADVLFHDQPGAVMSERSATDAFPTPAIAARGVQQPAQLLVGPPLPDALARGLLVVQYRAINLRIVPVYGPAALDILPRIGHLHITVDNAPWHWVDASGEPVIVQHLSPGPHRLLIELADPTHRVIDSATIDFEIPVKRPV